MSAQKAPTGEELLDQLEGLGAQPTSKPSKSTISTSTRPLKQSSSAEPDALLAELGNLASQRPASRPSTPSLRSTTTPTAGNRSPKRTSTATPPLPVTRSSEEKPLQRKSGDSTRSLHQSFTPATTTTEDSPEPEPKSTSPPPNTSSWWGGLSSLATAAVSTAQSRIKDIQSSEETAKWTTQLRNTLNADSFKQLTTDLQARALPTFQTILTTLAPPISSHERLCIHATHDLRGYPSLDPLIYAVFARVMAQVEGGDLLVVQRGSEAAPKRSSFSAPDRPRTTASASAGWHDGPWWKSPAPRSVNAVAGLREGRKLARASAEGFATEYFAPRGGVEVAAKQAAEASLSESNPTRNSDIFLAVQAVRVVAENEEEASGAGAVEGEGEVKEVPDEKKEQYDVCFAVALHDPVHGIEFAALSQALPDAWVEWLNATSVSVSDHHDDDDEDDEDDTATAALPPPIREIVESGGVDPREWVADWVEESLTLAVGVVAQRYVARRMGIGEPVKGKGREEEYRPDGGARESVASGGGEVARAGLGGL